MTRRPVLRCAAGSPSPQTRTCGPHPHPHPEPAAQGPPDQGPGSLTRAPWSPGTPARAQPRLQTCSAPRPGRHPGRVSARCSRRPGCRSRTPSARGALRAGRPQRPLPGQARSPPPREPASPRRHHHIVDDQVRRGQGPRAPLLPRAASFATPGPAPAAPIPLRRCSRRGRRHVKRLEPAPPARASPPGLDPARGGARDGGRRGRGRGAEPGTAPTAAAILGEGKGVPVASRL